MIEVNENQLKKVMKNFCKGTALPGFKELYNTSSFSVRLTWIFFIVSAFGIASYQITKTIIQYRYHPTITVIQPLESPIQYIPVQICYLHWIYWIDWKKALEYGFTKESVLYGMSFMTDIYSKNWFDIVEAKQQFELTMSLRSFKNLSEFYFAISNDDPPGFSKIDGLSNFTKKFHEYWTNELCYMAVPNDVKHKFVTSNDRRAVNMVYNGNYSNLYEFVSKSEYSHYIFAFLDSQIKSFNYSDYVLPPAVAVDGRFDDVFVSLDYYVYLIKVQISVQKWLNTEQKPCRRGSLQTTPTSDCYQICQLRNQIRNNFDCITFQKAVTLQNESFATLCNNDIIFFDENDSKLIDVDYNSMNVAASFDDQMKNFTNNYEFENCTETCLPSCEEWLYDYQIDTKTFISQSLQNRYTYVKVNYPAQSSILVMMETESQTWETLVGNIGGLMGLWLGASIISTVQMICLCCCTQQEKLTLMETDLDKNQRPISNGNLSKSRKQRY